MSLTEITPMDHDEEGEQKTLLITSPGSGIGKVLTPYLLAQGYSIIGLGSRNSGLFTKFLSDEGNAIDFIECDLISEDSLDLAFAEMKGIARKISGFIHLTGGSLYSKSIENLSLKEFNEVLAINITSSFLVGKYVFNSMKETGGGNIIFFGSTTGFEPSFNKMPYAVSKAAIHTMTQSFALEGSKYGILTNCIAPGYVMTERHVDELKIKAEKIGISFEKMLDEIKEKNSLKGELKTEDLIPIVDLLLHTTKMQGQVIRIDLGQVGF